MSNTASTKGRKIQIKQGLNKDFKDSVLDVGEFGLILDKNELRIGLADGSSMIVNGSTAEESQLASHEAVVASTVTLGHVKIGENIKVTDGIISIANSSTTEKGLTQLVDNLSTNDSTKALTAKQGYELKKIIDNLDLSGVGSGGITLAEIPDASSTQRGLMTTAQVLKLNGISSGANYVTVVDNLTSTSSSSALSAYQGKLLNDKLTDATTSKKGIVQLSDSTSSTSTTLAATANAVKKAYDLANAANYVLPNATTTTLGGVKAGSNITVSSGTISISNSSTSTRGVVQLSDSVSSTSSSTAATSYAVKQAYDLANTANNKASSSVNIFQHDTTKTSISNALGRGTVATGDFSNAQGDGTSATGAGSTSMGTLTTASGSYSHAQNYRTIANVSCSTAIGRYNKNLNGSATTNTSSSDSFVIGNGSMTSSSNAFRITFAGATYGQGSFNTTGADYAEYFEWQDSNPNSDDRVGYFVTLNGEKIEIANSKSDYIIGVISANPSVIGDSYQDQWQGMYVTDEWGRIQNEYIDVEYEDVDEEGNKVIKSRQDYVHKLNPNYDNESEYIPREQRKEWDAVGMLGKLLVRDDGTCEVNGYAKVADGGIATKSDDGYRVIKRVDENIVQIIFK